MNTAHNRSPSRSRRVARAFRDSPRDGGTSSAQRGGKKRTRKKKRLEKKPATKKNILAEAPSYAQKKKKGTDKRESESGGGGCRPVARGAIERTGRGRGGGGDQHALQHDDELEKNLRRAFRGVMSRDWVLGIPMEVGLHWHFTVLVRSQTVCGAHVSIGLYTHTRHLYTAWRIRYNAGDLLTAMDNYCVRDSLNRSAPRGMKCSSCSRDAWCARARRAARPCTGSPRDQGCRKRRRR